VIKVELMSTRALGADDWLEAQAVYRDGVGVSMAGRSPEELDYFVGLAEPERFVESHRDPNSEVGQRFGENQSFSEPIVALATEGSDIIGYAYAANNVSGTPEEQERKRLIVIKNYFWIREVAVKPDFQAAGLARQMSRVLLEDARAGQPAATYMYPKEEEFMYNILTRHHFHKTDEAKLLVFGEGSPVALRYRMQARFASSVLKSLRPTTGFNS
jgi:GNAT superfamily N-acetyltransferase